VSERARKGKDKKKEGEKGGGEKENGERGGRGGRERGEERW